MKQNKLLLKLIPPLLLGVTACTKSEEKKELLPKQEIVSEIKTFRSVFTNSYFLAVDGPKSKKLQTAQG